MTGSVATESTSAPTSEAANLLDVVLERVQKAGKTFMVTRVIIINRILKGREVSGNAQQEAFGRLIQRHAHTSESSQVTGALLVYPVCSILALEARTSLVMAILRDVATLPDLRHGECRVISCTEDPHNRYFNHMYYGYIPSASNVETMDALDAGGAVRQATEINTFLRQIAPSLQSPTDGETQRMLVALESYFDHVPTMEAVLSLCPSEDAPTVEEFLDIFDAPVNVDLESEQVWPMPQPLNL